jgi:hypothetical protein
MPALTRPQKTTFQEMRSSGGARRPHLLCGLHLQRLNRDQRRPMARSRQADRSRTCLGGAWVTGFAFRQNGIVEPDREPAKIVATGK